MSKNLLMITGLGSAQDLAQGKKGAFYNTLEEFHTYWDRIDIIVPRMKGSVTTELFGNVFLHPSSWSLIFHPIFFLQEGLRLHKKYRFDVMTVQEFPPFYNGIGAFLLWCRIKVPYLLEIHHVPGYPKAANLKEWLYRLFTQIFIALDAVPARAVRVVNKVQTKKFLINAGVPESKICYIPSVYIDTEIFRQDIEPKEYDLIFVGRLEKNKGIELFIESAKRSGLKAIIVGDGPEKESIKNSIKANPNIILYGWAKDSREIAYLINRSRLFVLTSYNEGGPRVVVEAMACGVPVLATPVGIVPDLKDACTVITWNVDDMVKKVQTILNNEHLYNMYSKSGLEVAKQFEKKSAIRHYAEKLQSFI